MADNYLERQASRAWDMDCYYMGRCGGDAVLMTAEIGMLAKGAVDATLAVYDGLKAAVGIGSDGGGFRLVSLAGGGQTVLAPAGVAVAEGTVEGILEAWQRAVCQSLVSIPSTTSLTIWRR